MEFPIYEVDEIIEGKQGVFKIAIVSDPAIMQNFIAMSKDKPSTSVKLSADKTRLIGPVLIPEQLIFRNIDGFQFYIKYSANIIEKCMIDFVKNNRVQETNLEHGTEKIEGGFYENWIDRTDQVGTWMTAFYPNEPAKLTPEFLETYVGFSIEGFFDLKQIEMNIIKQAKELLFGKEVEVKQLNVVAADGTMIVINDETLICTYEDGSAVPDGEYALENGDKLIVSAGVGVIEIAENEVDMLKAELEKSKLELETLKSELEKFKSEKEVIAQTLEKVIVEAERLETELKQQAIPVQPIGSIKQSNETSQEYVSELDKRLKNFK